MRYAATHFPYAVEPIVYARSTNWRGVELLARGTVLWTESRWDQWYASMPSRVEAVREALRMRDDQYEIGRAHV